MELLKRKEAGVLVGISRRLIYEWIDKSGLP